MVDALMILASVIIVVVMLSIAPGIQAQEIELIPITECLGGDQSRFGKWAGVGGYLVDPPRGFTRDEMETWETCYGPSLPDNIHLLQWLQYDDQWLAVLVSEDRTFVMVFNSLNITTDANGDNSGFHDICGVYEIPIEPYLLPANLYKWN